MIATSTLYKMSVGCGGGGGSLTELLNGAENKEFFFFSMVYLLFYNLEKNYYKDCAFILCTSK